MKREARLVRHTIHNIKKKIIRNKQWNQKLNRPLGKKVYIIGSPVYDNLGDSAIFIAETCFIKQCGISEKRIKEITSVEFYHDENMLKKHIKKKHLICCLGGGNMGNQWPSEEKLRQDIISDFPDNAIIIFPQTIYFLPGSDQAVNESIRFYTTHKRLIMTAREAVSFDMMKQYYPSIKVLHTPDIVLSSCMNDYGVKSESRNGILFCIRNDIEKKVNESMWVELKNYVSENGYQYQVIDMINNDPVTKENRLDCVRRKMEEFSRSELVITDRLHGMVFAAVTGTPCIVFPNNHHKVKGTYDWISYLPYIKYVETIEETIRLIPELMAMKNCQFDNKPLIPYFEQLAEVIKKKCR